MRVVILASGRGTRLAPLTNHQPKPLLPVANRPLLSYPLHAAAEAGFTEAVVTIGYQAGKVKDFFAEFNPPLVISLVSAPAWEQGAFTSLQAVFPLVNHDTAFALIPCDLYLNAENLRLLLDPSAEDPVILYDPVISRAGPAVHIADDGSLIDFRVIPGPDPSRVTSLPALLVTPSLLRFFQQSQSSPMRTVFDLLKRWIAQGHRLTGIPISSTTWVDVDAPADLLFLNHHLLTDAWPPTTSPPGTYLPEGVSLAGPLQRATLTLGMDTQLVGPILIGPRVYVGDHCTLRDGTTIGTYTTIHNNTHLSRTITFPHTQVPADTDLHHSILDAKGNIVQ